MASVVFVVFLAPPDPDGPTHDQRGRNGFTTSGKSLLYPFRFLSIPTSYKQELIFCISLFLCSLIFIYIRTWSPIWFKENTFVHYNIFCFDMIQFNAYMQVSLVTFNSIFHCIRCCPLAGHTASGVSVVMFLYGFSDFRLNYEHIEMWFLND